MLSIIVAFDNNQLIGANNTLPWHLPADLKYFKSKTTNHTIIMGRKTFESIGRPLPNRRNIILTTDPAYKADGVEIVHNIDKLPQLISSEEQAFVIGGANIYEQFLPLSENLYVTHIDHSFEGDTFFPKFSEEEWELVSVVKGEVDENNRYPFEFLHYQKKPSQQ